MENTLAIAIYTKLKQNINGNFVFNNGAFPVTAEGFTFQETADIRGAFDFAKLYNFIPTTFTDTLNKSDSDIWTICEQIVQNKVLSRQEKLSDENQMILDKIDILLKTKVLLDNSEVTTYDNYKYYSRL